VGLFSLATGAPLVLRMKMPESVLVRQAYLVRFDGKNWVQFSELLEAR